MYIYLRLILKMKMIFLQLIMLKTLVEEKDKIVIIPFLGNVEEFLSSIQNVKL